MKKNLVSVFSILTFGAAAQSSIIVTNTENNSVITPNQAVYVAADTSSIRKLEIDVKNNSNSTQMYDVKRYDVVLNSSATQTALAYFCFAGGCYSPADNVSQNTLTLTAGQSASGIQSQFQMLLAELEEISTKGFSHVKYTVINVNNPADSVQFSIRYNDVGTAVKEHQPKLSFELLPNPANDFVTVKIGGQGSTSLKLRLFNSLGAIAIEKQVPAHAEKATIDLSGLAPGVYFISFAGGEGAPMRKLIVQ